MLLVGLWLGTLLGTTYTRQISRPYFADRVKTVDGVLADRAKADYVYAMYAIAAVHQALVSRSILTAERSFALVDFFGLVFVFAAAALFLSETMPSLASRLVGMAQLAATSPLMFQRHYYHPSDFYGAGLMFLILMAARRHRLYVLGALCLASGFLWEKALFVPAIYFLWTWRQADVKTAAVRVFPALTATLGCFVFWRLAFPDAQRIPAYADWGQFLQTLPDAGLMWLLWTAPVMLALIDAFRSPEIVDRFWLYWLLYVPLLVAVIVVARGHLAELRSFWILQPIFVAVLASWAEARMDGRALRVARC